MTKWTGQAPLICKEDRGLNTPIHANNIKGGGGGCTRFQRGVGKAIVRASCGPTLLKLPILINLPIFPNLSILRIFLGLGQQGLDE